MLLLIGATQVSLPPKRKRPKPGRSQTSTGQTSGSDFGWLDLQELTGARDRDRPGLHRLWDLAHEFDVQKPVLQARALDLDMVSELEATFEVPRGDALVEHVSALLLVVSLLAADPQRVLLHLDRKISVGEAGDGDRDVIGVLAGALDIVRRIARCGAFHPADLVEHGEQPVEA